MKAMKTVLILVLLMAIFTLVIVPLENSVFPAWVDSDLMQLMSILVLVICVIVLMR